MTSFSAIDFETANRHRASVCSVGVVVVRGGEVTDRFYELICPTPNYYNPLFTEIHGLDYHDTVSADKFPEVWRRIVPRIKGLPLVAHNSPFDEGCLRGAHEYYGMEYPGYEFYCTCRLSRRAFPHLPNHKLPTVAAHVGFDFTNHHNALADAEACAEIAKVIWTM
jgi:DNA polymerase-3 subunit epsilon